MCTAKIFKLILFFILLTAGSLTAQVYNLNSPLAHTYSIVARDPNTGDMAVGVQSHWFSVGSIVSWGEAGVGVVATQSFVNPAYGQKGLQLLKEGKSPQEALDKLLEEDQGREVRQVAILDARGRAAVHTGKKCIQYAGHSAKQDYSVQANMMLNASVWPAMAQAFEENSQLPLPERVLAVLQAAESQGGDIRGRQSAVLLVVKGVASDQPWNGEIMNLQVADHADPLAELSRLLKVHRAYELMNQGDLAIENSDMAGAAAFYGQAQQMFPDNMEMKYWHAITLANNAQFSQAQEILSAIFQKDPRWKLLTQRLPEVGLLTVPEAELRKILALP